MRGGGEGGVVTSNAETAGLCLSRAHCGVFCEVVTSKLLLSVACTLGADTLLRGPTWWLHTTPVVGPNSLGSNPGSATY